MSDQGVTSLREMLGAVKDPDFELKLLPGWERHNPDDAGKEKMDAAMKQRFMAANRPELHATLRSQLEEAYALMQKQNVVAYFAQTGDMGDSKAYYPASMLAAIRRSQDGGDLGAYVAQAVRDHGAKPLFGDKRFIRFERESTRVLEGGNIVVTSIVYMTPIPGSMRRRGLQITASLARPEAMPATDEKFIGWKNGLDLCVSSLRWLPA